MKREELRRLLDRARLLRHACDLDLLVFFARHPRALLTSEQLAAWLGYDLKQIAESLESLLEGGVLTRAQNRAHAARMYVFAVGGASGGWLPTILELASTRAGRLAIVEALAESRPDDAGHPVAHGARVTAGPRRPFVIRRSAGGRRGSKAG